MVKPCRRQSASIPASSKYIDKVEMLLALVFISHFVSGECSTEATARFFHLSVDLNSLDGRLVDSRVGGHLRDRNFNPIEDRFHFGPKPILTIRSVDDNDAKNQQIAFSKISSSSFFKPK